MAYISVAQVAKKWKLSQRSVRNYCTLGRIPGAFLTGKTWNIPEDAIKPTRKPKPSKVANTVLQV
uniref:helix-turn-helix domain-containing protein n=1 Tax=Candidatus Avelusimicrobium stercoris TaxID=1947924 RepID=UPI003D0C61DF